MHSMWYIWNGAKYCVLLGGTSVVGRSNDGTLVENSYAEISREFREVVVGDGKVNVSKNYCRTKRRKTHSMRYLWTSH